MNSLGVFVKPIEVDDPSPMYYFMASPPSRMTETVVPCKKDDRSNVDTHHKGEHQYHTGEP